MGATEYERWEPPNTSDGSHRIRTMGATEYERWEPPNTIDVSHPFRRRSRAQYVCKTGCIMRWIRSSILVDLVLCAWTLPSVQFYVRC